MDKMLFIKPTGMMYKLFAGLLLCCVLITSCSKNQTTIQTETPQAIKELIQQYQTNSPDCGCHPYIRQYLWRNENVYFLGYNDALNIGFICDWLPTFYNSDGQNFLLDGGYTYEKYQDFLRTSQLVRTVWACE